MEEQIQPNRNAIKETYSIGQKWGAMRKAWKGYRIAKQQNNRVKIAEYQMVINSLQEQLGKSKTVFF